MYNPFHIFKLGDNLLIDIERTQKNHLNQTNFVPKKTVGTKAFKSSFNQAMHVHSKQTFSDRIEDLLEDGKRLVQSRTAGDLKKTIVLKCALVLII